MSAWFMIISLGWLLLGPQLTTPPAPPQTDQLPPARTSPLRGHLLLAEEFAAPTNGTALNRLRIGGKARLEFGSRKFSLNFSSYHWLTFTHIEQSVLSTPFENRHIVNSLYLEGRDLLLRGLFLRAGRLLPEALYAAAPLLDGGEIAFAGKGWRFSAAGGKAVDLWNGKGAPGDLHLAIGLSYTAQLLQLGASYYQGTLAESHVRELAAGLSLKFGNNTFLAGQAAWDFGDRSLARASASVVRRFSEFDFSIQASLWKNPAGRYFSSETGTGLPALPTLGNDEYRDVRLNLGWHPGGFSISASGGLLGGVRTGTLGNLLLQFPALLGARLSLGGYYLDSAYMLYYACEAGLSGRIGQIGLELQSQTRLYHWKNRPDGWWNSDNQTMLQVDIPLAKKILLLLEGGMVFRDTANEKPFPLGGIRLLWRF